MAAGLAQIPDRFCVLLVDDEPDIHAVTKLSLKGLQYGKRKLRFLSAASGREAVEAVRANPDVAVVLLDVVMETPTAGLDACRTIREDLGNRAVRILLRTGQPGTAPERATIDTQDVDGYLPKADLSTDRLYSAVRSALKAWSELVELDRLRRAHAEVRECSTAVAGAASPEAGLRRVLESVLRLCPAPAAAADVVIRRADGPESRATVGLVPGTDPAQADARAASTAARLPAGAAASSAEGGPAADGWLIPFTLPRDRGAGWIHLEAAKPEEWSARMLPVLADHAAHALAAGCA